MGATRMFIYCSDLGVFSELVTPFGLNHFSTCKTQRNSRVVVVSFEGFSVLMVFLSHTTKISRHAVRNRSARVNLKGYLGPTCRKRENPKSIVSFAEILVWKKKEIYLTKVVS